MKNFNFWQKWILFVGIYLVVFGFVMAFYNQSELFDLAFNNHINPVFWNSESIPKNAELFQAWIYGVLGSTISGWGLFITFLAHVPFKKREKWAWNCIAIGILIWFVPDMILTIYYQVTFNVFFNMLMLFLFGLPLLFTKKYFDK